MSYYVYHTRFQPLTKLHEKELSFLANYIDKNDKIIIGIVNYYPQFESKEDSDWLNFDVRFNPLSYWERYMQILSFVDSSLKDKIEAIVALPRPSKVEEKVLNNFLPPKKERKMCLPCVRKYDDQIQKIKRRGLENNAEEIFDIKSYEFGSEYTIASSSLMFLLMWITNRYDVCKHFVSDRIIESMRKSNVLNRLRMSINDQNFVEDEIKSIYSIALIDKDSKGKSEKEIIYNILKEYDIDIAVEPPPASIIGIGGEPVSNIDYIERNRINNDVSEIFSKSVVKIQNDITTKKNAINNNSGKFIDLMLSQQVYVLESFCEVLDSNKHEVLNRYINIKRCDYAKFLDTIEQIIENKNKEITSYIGELNRKQEPKGYRKNIAAYTVDIKSGVKIFIEEINKFKLVDILEMQL